MRSTPRGVLVARLDAVRQSLNAAAELVPAPSRPLREPPATGKITVTGTLASWAGKTAGFHARHRLMVFNEWRRPSFSRGRYDETNLPETVGGAEKSLGTSAMTSDLQHDRGLAIRVLVVEDEPKLSGFLQKGLSERGFTVDVAPSGEVALELVRKCSYDLVILDVVLPGANGFDVCAQLRTGSLDLPILMLSARGMVDDRVQGLNAGADDYLTKPFAFAELDARVRALLRRPKPSNFLTTTVDDLVLDPVARTVHRGGRRIDLSPKEFALLQYLMGHQGEVVTRQMIAEHVWGLTWDRLTNVIDVYINHLRRKIEAGDARRLIFAVRGVGYRLGGDEDA